MRNNSYRNSFSLLFYRSSFSEFSSRVARDDRYKAIEKMRERENLFSDFLDELRRKEKDEKHQRKEQVSLFEFLFLNYGLYTYNHLNNQMFVPRPF